MAPLTPYTYIQCPCSEDSRPAGETPSPDQDPAEGELDDDDRTFDPRAPRANYSLHPLEYLMYCEDCHQIRCPRCVNEEIVTYYCPNCLFEVPSSNLKSEGNRCTRSCFQCPICIGPLAVTSLESAPEPGLLAADNAAPPGGPYILTCSYCNWSSTEIGIRFDKPNGIYQQLTKMHNGGKPRLTNKEFKEYAEQRKENARISASSSGDTNISRSTPTPSLNSSDVDHDLHFSALKAFYQQQLADSNPQAGSGLSSLGDLGIASPGSLSRIMSLYTGGGAGHGAAHKQSRGRVPVMHEALSITDGLKVADLDETSTIDRMRCMPDIDETITREQAAMQLPPHDASTSSMSGGPSCASGSGPGGAIRFASDLRPIPYLLRTKRSKRCPLCRHIISKPESKISNTRFRIRLVAGSYIPTVTVRPLHSEANNVPSSLRPPLPQELWLSPLKPAQYLLTFKNPIFETVKVTLATPAKTPGRFASTVTVMCPQFEIDANTDMWDDALKEDGGRRGGGSARQGEEGTSGADGGAKQPEPGKIWERGRNWVSVVVEVVPASLRVDLLPKKTLSPAKNGEGEGKEEDVDRGPLKEDEDVLEIPMFVRIEWEAEPRDEVGSAPGKDKEAKEKRELAYWCVLGLGRISQG